jgi:hypothetical protein
MWCDVVSPQQMQMRYMWIATCQRSRLPSEFVRTMRLNCGTALRVPLPSLRQDSHKALGMPQPPNSHPSTFACRPAACCPECTSELSSVRPVHKRPQQLPLPYLRPISQRCRGMPSPRWRFGCRVISVSSMPSGVVSPSQLHVRQMQIGSHGGPRMSRSDWVYRITAAGRNSNRQSRCARA